MEIVVVVVLVVLVVRVNRFNLEKSFLIERNCKLIVF